MVDKRLKRLLFALWAMWTIVGTLAIGYHLGQLSVKPTIPDINREMVVCRALVGTSGLTTCK